MSPRLPGRHVRRRPISDPGGELELRKKRQGRQETHFRPGRRSQADPGDKFGDRPSENLHVRDLPGFMFPPDRLNFITQDWFNVRDIGTSVSKASHSQSRSRRFEHWLEQLILYCNPKGCRALLRIPSTRRAKCLPMLGSLKT